MPNNPAQLIGESPAFHWLMDRVSDAAALEKPVLIVGERGTGKELIASRLHFLSPRWEQDYVQVNCGAYSDTLLDAMLFGQVYYDGRTDIDGQFIRAEGGTLFLDNIESVSLRLQEKLLQALDYGIIDPLGSPDTQTINVRLIASTAIDLPRAVAQGRFRADLLDHLSFDVLTLPPLRARRKDISVLSDHFGRKFARELGVDRFLGFTPEVIAKLNSQEWSGNIRELKTVIERSVAKAFLEDETLALPIREIIQTPFETAWPIRETQKTIHQGHAKITSENKPAFLNHETNPPDSHPVSASETIAKRNNRHRPLADTHKQSFSTRILDFERSLIDEALSVSDNHQGQAAEYLDLTYHQFRGLLRKHGLKK